MKAVSDAVRKVVESGGTFWIGPSTNATCQPEKPEKPENQQVNTWGVGHNLGVQIGHPRNLSSNGREGAARKNLRNVGDTGTARKSNAVKQNAPSELARRRLGSRSWSIIELSWRAGKFLILTKSSNSLLRQRRNYVKGISATKFSLGCNQRIAWCSHSFVVSYRSQTI
jgi:hypothetical protein